MGRDTYALNNPVNLVDPSGHSALFYSTLDPDVLDSFGSGIASFASDVLFNADTIKQSVGLIQASGFDSLGDSALSSVGLIGIAASIADAGFTLANPVKAVTKVNDIAKFVTPSKYDGVKQLSELLISNGVSRSDRLNIIKSFPEGSIQAKTALESKNVLRYYGGTSRELGNFVTPSFSSTGSANNILSLPSTNTLESIAQFQLRQGSLYFEGVVAENFGKVGGGIQYYVPDLSDLLLLGK